MSATNCWNCRQPVQLGVQACLWCGVAQKAPATQFVVAPSANADRVGQQPTVLPSPAGTSLAPDLNSMPSIANGMPLAPKPVRGVAVKLGPQFTGVAAGVAPQTLAFTVDMLLAAGLLTAVHLVWDKPLLTLIAALELAVLWWVMEARSGLTPGNALLRLRTSKADMPWSPGLGKAFVKQAITGAGLLVVVVGAWAVAASGGMDPTHRGRSLAARASGTQAVALPSRVRQPRTSKAVPLGGAVATGTTANSGEPWVTAPNVAPAQEVIGLAQPQVVSTLATPAAPYEDSLSMSMTGPHIVRSIGPAPGTEVPAPEISEGSEGPEVSEAPAPPAPATPPQSPVPVSAAPVPAVPVSAVPVPPAQETPAPSAPTPTPEPPASPAPSRLPSHHTETHGSLLFIFDTGQRETVPLPANVNLGRKPNATLDQDHLIGVKDPDGSVSKTHLRLEYQSGSAWVTDQGSTNGSELLQETGEIVHLSPHQPAAVEPGTRVRIGNRTFTLSVVVDSPAQNGDAS